jgi:hypothetical protein
MPTRIEVNLTTGETTEIELVGEELATYQASLAQQQAEAQQTVEVVATPSEGAPNGSNN